MLSQITQLIHRTHCVAITSKSIFHIFISLSKNICQYLYLMYLFYIYTHIFLSTSQSISLFNESIHVAHVLFSNSLPIYWPNIHHYYKSGRLTGFTMKIIYRSDLRPTKSDQDIHTDGIDMSGWLRPTQHTRMYQSIVGAIRVNHYITFIELPTLIISTSE